MNRRSGIPVNIDSRAADALRAYGGLEVGHERGGLLIGYWNCGAVNVHHITEVADPQASSTSWTRREEAAQDALDQARTQLADARLGYVGDWHTHLGTAGASPADEHALRRASEQYDQPIVLVVVLSNGAFDLQVAHAGRHQPHVLAIESIKESK